MSVLSQTTISTGGACSWPGVACWMYSNRSFHWLASVSSALASR